MTERREFLVTLGAAATIRRGWTGDGSARVTVEARATVFHRAPDGRLVLVRFIASGTDAIAGRLRVFDRRGRLMGTAGMLRDGAVLLGELWLPLDRPTRVVSALETPGTRVPHRTEHLLQPPPKWTIHWLASAAAEAVVAREEGWWWPLRGALSDAAARAGLRIAPVPAELQAHWTRLDHVSLVRSAAPAVALSGATGIPVAEAAVLAAPPAHAELALALAGSGVGAVVVTGAPSISRLNAPDGTGVYVFGVGRGAGPDALALEHGRAAAARRIEPWLATLPVAAGDPQPRALMAGASPDAFAECAATVREWTGTYAYPRIVMGDVAGYRAYAVARVGGVTAVPALVPPVADRPDDVATLAGAGARRTADRRRAARLFAPLAAVAARADTLDALAARIPFPISGLAVFNPSPFARSDVVAGPDGKVQVVTDVPGLGYATVPTGGSAWRDDPSGHLELRGAVGRVAIDPRSGAIAAIDAPDGAAVLGAGGAASVLDGARLASWTAQVVPGIAYRLVLVRVIQDREVTTTVTTYDALPWVDVADRTPYIAMRRIGLVSSPAPASMSWEVAGGMRSADEPVARATMLHWLAVPRERGTLLVAASGVGALSSDAGGRIDLLGGEDITMRIAYQPGLLADDAWRLGWSVVPFRVAPAGGTGVGAGAGTLPSFGSLLGTDQAGVAVIDLVDEADALVVYVQELAGTASRCRVVPGVLAFGHAEQVDLAGRRVGEAAVDRNGGVEVRVRALGFAAVRVWGLRLNVG